MTETKRSICSICSGQCPVDVTTENGVVTRVRPVADKSFAGAGPLCIRGAVGEDYVNHADRVRSPLRRVGKKGEGRFEPISWDEAYATIGEKLCAYRSSFGADSVAFFSGFSKWYRHWLQRLAWSFGTENYGTESSSCHRSTAIAKLTTTGFEASPDLANASSAVVIAASRLMPGVKKQCARGMKLVVIEPRTSPDIEEYADVHLRPIPGTDGAVACGLAREIIENGWADMDYIEKYVHGFNEYREYTAQFTPERVQQLSGVDADALRRAARILAENRPVSIVDGFTGIIHQRGGMQAFRAYTCLSAILGCYGLAGGNLPTALMPASGHVVTSWRSYAFAHENRPENSLRIGADRFPVWTAATDEFQAMDLARHIREQRPYPLKAIFALGMNARMFPDSGAMFSALEQLEFFVDVDLFMTDTAKYADIVLPAAASFERDQLGTIARDRFLYYSHRAADPGLARSDEDIICDLARYIAPQDELLCAGRDACYRFMLERLPWTLEDIKQLPPQPLPPVYAAPEPLKDGFNTPTGRFEIYSELIAGIDGFCPLPEYSPGAEPATEELPLLLMAGVRAGNYEFAFHTRTHRVERLRALRPEPSVDMHPEDMAQLGLAPGDSVVLSTAFGSIAVKCAEDCRLMRGTVNMYHDYSEADVNSIIPADYLDPYSGFPGYKAIRCRVGRA